MGKKGTGEEGKGREGRGAAPPLRKFLDPPLLMRTLAVIISLTFALGLNELAVS